MDMDINFIIIPLIGDRGEGLNINIKGKSKSNTNAQKGQIH